MLRLLYQQEVVWNNLQRQNLILSKNNTLVLGNYRGWYFEKDPYEKSEKLIFHATELVYNLVKHSELYEKSLDEIRVIVFPETFYSLESQLIVLSPNHPNYPSEWLECFIANSPNEFERLIDDYFSQVISKMEEISN